MLRVRGFGIQRGRGWIAILGTTLRTGLLLIACFQFFSSIVIAAPESQQGCVPILLYHRFGTAAGGDMTVTMTVFEQQLRILRDGGFRVISLAELIGYLGNREAVLPSKSVVITSDDGHISVYQKMFPIIRRERMPVTLFIYPSAISNADYAMTWAQLREMHATGLVDIQSHTFWHPNFMIESKRLSPDAYRHFVMDQLQRSKKVLEQALGAKVDLLAWPFGLYDADLIRAAEAAGYAAAVTIERRPVTVADSVMILPRYIVTNGDTGAAFRRLLSCPGDK